MSALAPMAERHGLLYHPAIQDRPALAKLLNHYHPLVSELGGNPVELLEAEGIEPWTLQDATATVPYHKLGSIMEATAHKLGCSDFGMRLAERQSLEKTMEPLDRLLFSAPTIKDAITCCIQHMDVYNSGLLMELSRLENDRSIVHFETVDGMALFPQLMEQMVLLGHISIAGLSADFARSQTIWFSHLNISRPIAYAKRFHAVVEFGREYDGYLLRDSDLTARVIDYDAERFNAEKRQISQKFPERSNSIDVVARQLIYRMLVEAEPCTRRNVARILGLQERTFNRRLAGRSTSFERIRDDVRRNMAYRYLSRPDLPLTEIAGRIGYSELAVLSRSCRRWFGTSPRQLRRKLRFDDRSTARLH